MNSKAKETKQKKKQKIHLNMTLAHKRGYLIYGIIKQLIYKNVLKVSRNISNGCFQFSNQKPVAASFFSQPSSKKSHYFTPMSQQWRLGAMPPCSNPISADKNGPPSRLEGVWHLITFKGMLSSYVVGSTAVGYYMAPGPCDVKKLMVCCGGTALTVLSANAFNQIYESELIFFVFIVCLLSLTFLSSRRI